MDLILKKLFFSIVLHVLFIFFSTYKVTLLMKNPAYITGGGNIILHALD